MTDHEHFDWVWTKWNEHVSKRGLPTDLEYPYGEVPITRYLERGARDHPERPAVNFYGRDVSYRELDEYCNRFANFLIDKGYGRGDYVAIHLYNCPQYNIPINEPLREKWAEISNGAVLMDVTYGLTETLSMNTFTYGLQDVDLKKQEEKGGVFVGLPMPGTLIKFVDLVKFETLPPNEVGQLAIRDPALSLNYFKREGETRNLYLEDGFLLTGDLGMYDEDGFVYYKGRTKEIIKVSGYTVSPREIELVIGRHKDIRSVAVVGAPDARQGEIPVAFIVLRPEAVGRTTPDDLRQWFREKMSGYKVPKHVVLKEELPMLLGLKVDRRQLQREAMELAGHFTNHAGGDGA